MVCSSHSVLSLTQAGDGLPTKQSFIVFYESSLTHTDIPPHPSHFIPSRKPTSTTPLPRLHDFGHGAHPMEPSQNSEVNTLLIPLGSVGKVPKGRKAIILWCLNSLGACLLWQKWSGKLLRLHSSQAISLGWDIQFLTWTPVSAKHTYNKAPACECPPSTLSLFFLSLQREKQLSCGGWAAHRI